MKIHRILVENIVAALEDIFREGVYADKVIERYFKNHRKWGSRDRKFFAESVYEVVRWYRLLAFIADTEDDFWSILAVHWMRQGHQLPDMEEFDGLDERILDRENDVPNVAIEQSIPDWMYERGLNEIGPEWDRIVAALNKPADVFLRANALKATPEELIGALRQEDIFAERVSKDLPHAVRLSERKNVHATKAFRDGLFEVQDAASQMVVPLLGVEPGHRVVDACAGAGGKSLHMASLMKNKGKIISMDIHEWKLKELKDRARRNGVDVIETRLIDSSKVIKRMAETADRVLLDVPCSGIGVLRRNPDAKWKLGNEEIERLKLTQAEILATYSQMTKKGGKLVYATCSLLPSENEQQVQKFLADHGDSWTLEKEIHIRPDREGFDGFYGALLTRNK
ncbi:Ribosomal RNA small subunit methyltransferase B [compost metagenome]